MADVFKGQWSPAIKKKVADLNENGDFTEQHAQPFPNTGLEGKSKR